mgnify:CR=1 FL=1
MKVTRKPAFALLCLLALAASASGATYTYEDLVSRLTDLEALAVLPAAGERCSQWSSYDRASVYDAASGKYVNWDANGDGGGIIREENGQLVFAEMEGPGCIWRIWSAAPKEGHVRIYLDGAAEPVVDLPFAGYFDRQNAPFVYPSLVHDAASGKNCYVPIPYQKSCKITADKGWGAYYQFVYTSFPKGTVVPTFRRDLPARDRLALRKADQILTDSLGTDPAAPRPGEARLIKPVSVPPGSKVTLTEIKGPRAITAIHLRLNPGQYADEDLRLVSLRIYWDGESQPSVWTPLVDFFGSAPGINEYKSLPLGMADDGLYSFWYMPFARNARIEITNDGAQRFSGSFRIVHAPLAHPIDRLARFHAKWHRDAFLPTEPERWIDWTMLATTGQGRYCGVMLEVWNPRGGWWGEGDEKFFVDGEKFPSTIGTGSEDYFGYAWCNPTLFENAYHNQTRNDGNNVGHVSVNRWHIADNIPFHKSFDGYIEKYYPNNRPTLYAAVAYWYLAPGGTDPYTEVPASERIFYVEAEIYKVPGAIEGEKLEVAEKTGGEVQRQDMTFWEDKWSNLAQLWWTSAKPGDRLVLRVPAKTAGRQEVLAQFTKAEDYGIFQLYLDGQKIGEPIDLYNNVVIPTGEVSLGTFELTEGEHLLGVEVVGANPQAAQSYLFGLDYVRLMAK